MWRNAHIVCLSNRSDLLHLPKPTSKANIRLDDINCLERNQIAKLIFCIQHLTGCERNIGVLAELCKRAVVLRPQRLLNKEWPKRRKCCTQIQRTSRLKDPRVWVQPDIDIVADRQAHCLDPSNCITNDGVPWHRLVVRRHWAELDHGVAIALDQRNGMLSELLGRVAVRRLIYPHLVTTFATQKTIHRET